MYGAFPRDIPVFPGDCIAAVKHKTNFANAAKRMPRTVRQDLKSELGCRGSIEISFVFTVRVFLLGIPSVVSREYPRGRRIRFLSSRVFAERGKFGGDRFPRKERDSEIADKIQLNRDD